MSPENSDARQSSAATAVPHVVIPGQTLIRNYRTPTDPRHRYIGRIKTIDGGAGTGTLTTVTTTAGHVRNIVITAAHVIYDADTYGPVAQATFTPAYCPGSAPGTGNNPPSAPFGIYVIGAEDMWIPAKYSSRSKYRYDYGVLLVRRPLNAMDFPAPPTMGDIDPAQQNTEVYGYPGIADGNMAGCAGDLLFSNKNGLALYNASTGPGSSGAAVVQTAAPTTIIAVHVTGDTQMDLNMGPLLSGEVRSAIKGFVDDKWP